MNKRSCRQALAAVVCAAVALSAFMQASARDLIVIDAGHGGADPGAVKGWVREKDVNLAVAKRLNEYLKKKLTTASASIVMTRTGDKTLTLSQRAAIANKAQKPGMNGIFISLHCNAATNKSARGIETYVHNNKASDARAARLARRENIGAQGNYSMILLDMNNKLHSARSNDLAKSVHTEILRRAHAHDRLVRQAPFYVLFYSQMPSILVELGFLSNTTERKSLQTAVYQQKLAEALGDGVIQFLSLSTAADSSR